MKNPQGFVMADALIALFLLSLTIFSLLAVNQRSLEIAKKSASKNTAIYIAKSLLEDPSLRGTSGDIKINGNTFYWSKSTFDRNFHPKDKARLNDVTIEIKWTLGNSNNVFTLHATRINGRNG